MDDGHPHQGENRVAPPDWTAPDADERQRHDVRPDR